MAWFKRLKKQQPNRIITAETLRTMAEVAEWASRIRGDAPIGVDATAFGPVVRYVGPIFGAYVAVVAVGGISARSGSTPGNGNVTLQTWSGTALANMAGAGATVKAFNISAATGGIAAGKYCIVLKIASAYWIITSEC